MADSISVHGRMISAPTKRIVTAISVGETLAVSRMSHMFNGTRYPIGLRVNIRRLC